LFKTKGAKVEKIFFSNIIFNENIRIALKEAVTIRMSLIFTRKNPLLLFHFGIELVKVGYGFNAPEELGKWVIFVWRVNCI